MKKIADRKYSLIFLIVSVLIFICSIFMNQGYFGKLEYENVAFYQIRSVMCVLSFYLLGWMTLKSIRCHLPEKWIYLLAFPVGLCIWSETGIILMLCQIPFCLQSMLIAIALEMILLLKIFGAKREDNKSGLEKDNYWSIVIGLAFLVSTGWNYIILSYDSYFYFINYGKALTQIGEWAGFSGENSYVLTNIGQFIPIIHTMPAFWGLEQSYQIQTFMSLNLLCIFGTLVYDRLNEKVRTKLTMSAMLMTVVFLAVSTNFIFSTSWVLANAYCMFFVFCLFALGEKKQRNTVWDKDEVFVLMLMLTGLTLMRKDGLVFSCFCMIGLLIKGLTAKQAYLAIIPGIIINFAYIMYVRNVLSAQVTVAMAASIQNDDNILFLIACTVGIMVYISIRKYLLRWWRWKEESLILIAIVAINMLILLLMPMRTIDNIDDMFKNLFLQPSSSGISMYIFSLLLCFILAGRGSRLSYSLFYCIGYCLLTFCAYNIAKNSWVNIDDSFLRVLLQIVPVFVYWISMEIGELLLGDKWRGEHV